MSKIEIHGKKIDFGRYGGELWTRLPISYLKWILNTFDNEREAYVLAQTELDRRGIVIDQKVEISEHAIDRASLRCMSIWRETRQANEGLHAWLYRCASEAFWRINYKSGCDSTLVDESCDTILYKIWHLSSDTGINYYYNVDSKEAEK